MNLCDPGKAQDMDEKVLHKLLTFAHPRIERRESRRSQDPGLQT